MKPEKRSLRSDVRAARAGIPEAQRDAASGAASARALELPEVTGARTVLAYAATEEELDPSTLVEALRARGARIAYPRVCGPGALSVHWAAPDDLAPGYCGVLEPAEDAELTELEEIDLVLVPGVAFDEACGRLGMGGGFYDRLLADVPSHASTVGFAFDEQIVAGVPVERHDLPIEIVVTPTRVLRRTRPTG